MTEMSKDG